jgi:uncharacterized protein YjiS (DUF1127 family)
MANEDALILDGEVPNVPGLTILYITPLSKGDDGYCVLTGTFSARAVVPIHSHTGQCTSVTAPTPRRTSARRIDGDISYLSILGRVVRSLSAWRARARIHAAERQSLSSLARLDDHTLGDIGLNRADLTARWLCRPGVGSKCTSMEAKA